MATIEKRVRNGRVTYRARYRDPAGGQRSRVFARKADAQRFLNETETAKARGTWTDPALGRVLFQDWLREWWATTTNLRPKTRDRTSCCFDAWPCRASALCRWRRSASGTCAPGWLS